MRWRTTLAVAVAATLSLVAAAVPAAAAATESYVLYYTAVGTYQGSPETLWTIAGRFLGDADRAGELLDLNSADPQPDGARLTDPAIVHAGWNLVMPWDAIGSDLHYGVLPPVTSKPSAGASARPTTPPVPRQQVPQRPLSPPKTVGQSRPGTTPGSTPNAGSRPTPAACRPISPPDLAWGQQQLNPSQSWRRADGDGVRLAVVGSGVDGTRVDLAGRVAAGADIVGGTGRGDADCLGTGTAMALFAAADDGAAGRRYGVAPGATVVPIRIADHTAEVPADRAATAVQVAVSTGAQVIVLGSEVDISDPAVRKSVDNAIARDVVVVAPVPPKSKTVSAAADGLLRVGGVDQNKATAAGYPAGAVDLVAPGPGPYAAAFVAGTVALVRSDHPDLGAVEAARQVLRTATSWQQPEKYGAGLVNPVDAVGRPLPAGVQRALDVAARNRDSGGDDVLGAVVLVALIVLVAVLILVFWLRRLRLARTAKLERDRATDRQDDPFHEKSGAELVGS